MDVVDILLRTISGPLMHNHQLMVEESQRVGRTVDGSFLFAVVIGFPKDTRRVGQSFFHSVPVAKELFLRRKFCRPCPLSDGGNRFETSGGSWVVCKVLNAKFLVVSICCVYSRRSQRNCQSSKESYDHFMLTILQFSRSVETCNL